MVSDLGGFVAAGYKRGIRYINVPTTLMGQADAAIGGKTAVNLRQLKNQVGFFHVAAGIFILPDFLKTLPAEHLRSGFAEIIKCSLTGNGKLWRKIAGTPLDEHLSRPVDGNSWSMLIAATVNYKNRVIMKDFHEHHIRKALNFGHTIGHALEGYSGDGFGRQVTHGDAVAAGMICAAYLSNRKAGLPPEEMQRIVGFLDRGYPHLPMESSHTGEILDLLLQDKKNRDGKLLFSLIGAPGRPKWNVCCSTEDVGDALAFYSGLDEIGTP
jgi:3-dehydroquinate synthase